MDLTQLESNTLLIVRAEDLQHFAESLSIQKTQIIQKTDESEQPVPQSEACKFLGKSRQTFTKWRRDGLITGHKLGGRIFFFKSELLQSMKRLDSKKKLV
jgi:hypothetical protein